MGRLDRDTYDKLRRAALKVQLQIAECRDSFEVGLIDQETYNSMVESNRRVFKKLVKTIYKDAF